MATKFCKDCTHYTKEGHKHLCGKDEARDRVTGESDTCHNVRSNQLQCGDDAKWFEAAPPAKPEPTPVT